MMTTKQAIIEIVDDLNEVQARTLLTFLEVFAHEAESPVGVSAGAPSVDVELTMDTSDPMTGIIGIFGSGEPSDITNHKDEYIADAIESHWK